MQERGDEQDAGRPNADALDSDALDSDALDSDALDSELTDAEATGLGAHEHSAPGRSSGAVHEPGCAHEPHERRAPREASPPLVVERAAALFRALGDTARLSLLERLAGGEFCVTELAEATGEGLSTISQRLRTLRSERLLRRRRVGKHVYYTLADHHVVDLIRSAIEHARE